MDLEALAAFQEKLSLLPRLAIPRSQGTYIVHTDACDRQIGGVAFQKQPGGHKKLIRYWSRSLTETALKYGKTHWEFFSITWEMLLDRSKLEATRFTTRSEHGALKWILDFALDTSHFAKWPLRLSEMKLDVIHRARINHHAVDTMSRLSTIWENCSPIYDALPVMSVSSPPRDERKSRIKLNNLIYDCHNTDITSASPILPAICITKTPNGVNTTPTLSQIVAKQAKDALCRQMTEAVWTSCLCYSLHFHRIFVHFAPLDGAVQTVVPNALRSGLLYFKHHLNLTWIPVERCMYNNMKCEPYWPHIVNYV